MNNPSSSPILYLVDDDDDDDESFQSETDEETNERPSTEIKRKNSFSTRNLAFKRSRNGAQTEPIVLGSDDSNDETTPTEDTYAAFDWTRGAARSTRIRSESTNFPSLIPLISNYQKRTTNEFESAWGTAESVSPMANRTFPTTKIDFPQISTVHCAGFRDCLIYRCDFCKFSTKIRSDLFEHVLTHIFSCSMCSFFSFSQHRLRQHLSEEHRVEQEENSDQIELISVRRNFDGTFSLTNDDPTSNFGSKKSCKHRRDFSPSSPRLTEVVAQCVQSLVNTVVVNEENSSDFPNIFVDAQVNSTVHSLKLRNKFHEPKIESDKSTFQSLKKRFLRSALRRDETSNGDCSNSSTGEENFNSASQSPLNNVIVLD